ncbi:restriction endonuclease subunit S [Vibrio parahaemolyticus]|uniref:restriction endonuclease subunit S n=1 Tax=Vibrio parahaemolyticus TaxID=670 RepID=UPI00146A0063|nr:restriction endonuclease subunit S [Vibrio parahaemolyticus]MDF5700444.1 restriction endonuclease subunit S [Vibrio parahaemolyticus]NMU35692.1 restriction endonuclease subunit S [Vibrio parahaemolyticus]
MTDLITRKPSDWDIKNLENIATFITKGATPTTYGFEWVEESSDSIPFLRSECVTANGFNRKGMNFISKKAHVTMGRSKIKSGDILMTITGNIGRIATLPDEIPEANINQHIAKISVIDGVSSSYVAQALQQERYNRYYERILTGQAYPQISLKQVRETPILLPPHPEQQKIAEVLSTVDKKIALIDQKIAETEKLKTGLMQKLFLEGVGVQDENGEWQPHTEFQDSPFGKIPQPWSTLELAEIADIEDGDRGKSYPKQADFSDFGYCLFLSAKNVTKQGFSYRTTQFISQEKHNKLRKGQVLQNDIVLTTRGTVGNFGLFKNEELFDAVRINSGMAIIRCIDSSMPNYLYQFMQSPQFKAQISKVVFGSAQPQLTIKQIKKFKVLVPPSEEKKWIEETLKLANDKLTLLEQQKAETQQLKKGLMQKLLTGEWRVPVEETEAA